MATITQFSPERRRSSGAENTFAPAPLAADFRFTLLDFGSIFQISLSSSL